MMTHYVRLITSASALIESRKVILTFTFSPSLTFLTKTQNPLKLAMPSPFGLIWLISTSYSLPNSTGQSTLWRLFLAFLGLLFLGLIDVSLHFQVYSLVSTSHRLSIMHRIPGIHEQYAEQIANS